MRSKLAILRRASVAYSRLSARERMLILITGAALVCTGVYLAAAEVQEYVDETRRMTIVRSRELEQLGSLIQRYGTLNARLERIQATYAESRLTFEEVTNQLDKIVRESIGSDKYDLRKGRPPEQLGFDSEKQEFNLKISSLTLEQLVRLLFELERGRSPLFLGRVDIVRAGDSNFGATLEIFSIRKSSGAAA